MRVLYTLLLYLLLPYILIRLYLKGRKNPDYLARVKERFLWGEQTQKPVDVWIHAVSMGEVVASKMLIQHHLENNQRVLMTTMTPTGSAQVTRLFGDKVYHQYLPYDYPRIVKRFFKTYAPKLCIIMETEIWPNLIVAAKKQGAKLYIANGRISDAAFPAYKRFSWFFKPLLRNFDGIYVQSESDADRFKAMGAPYDRVSMLGNMKSDLSVPADISKPLLHLKDMWGVTRAVVIAASTHEGEEEALLKAFNSLQKAIPNVILLIAPRHPERFEAVYVLARSYPIKVARRSQQDSITESSEVVILDSLGELLGFYGLSDYAFVGGSLVPIGGHNVLEPIALNVPVVCGQYMQNSQSLCDELLRDGAILQANTAESVITAIIGLHENEVLKTEQIAKARRALKANQGSVTRHIHKMSEVTA